MAALKTGSKCIAHPAAGGTPLFHRFSPCPQTKSVVLVTVYFYGTKFTQKLMQIGTWILHESETFICEALKGDAIVHYCEPLITKQMEASGSPLG
jgi:hypothetical protein